MNAAKWGLVTVSIVSMLVVAACGQQENPTSVKEDVQSPTAEMQRETKEAVGAIQNFTIEQKDVLQKQVQDQLSSLNDKVNDLQAKAENASAESKIELNTLTAGLNQKLQTAKEWAEQLKEASADTWDEAKGGLASAIQDIEATYNEAVSRLQ